MNVSDGWRLAYASVIDPVNAAKWLMANPFPRRELWSILFLVTVLSTLLYVLVGMISPPPPPEFEIFFLAPHYYFIMLLTGLVLTSVAITLVGRILGGKGQFNDLLLMVSWLQILQLIAAVAVILSTFVAPLLSGFMQVSVFVLGLYILAQFIDQAHQFNSIGKAIGVLFASVIVIVLFATLILALLSPPMMGSFSHV